MLASRQRIAAKVRSLAASSDRAEAMKAGMARIAADIETYVWVQTLTGVMLAGVSGAVMVGVGLDNALFWTIILFLLSYIPIIGVTVGSVAPALFALLQFPTVWQAVVVLAGIQLAAFVVGTLFYPPSTAAPKHTHPPPT